MIEDLPPHDRGTVTDSSSESTDRSEREPACHSPSPLSFSLSVCLYLAYSHCVCPLSLSLYTLFPIVLSRFFISFFSPSRTTETPSKRGTTISSLGFGDHRRHPLFVPSFFRTWSLVREWETVCAQVSDTKILVTRRQNRRRCQRYLRPLARDN